MENQAVQVNGIGNQQTRDSSSSPFTPLLYTGVDGNGFIREKSNGGNSIRAFQFIADDNKLVEQELREIAVGHNLNSVLNGMDSSSAFLQSSFSDRFFSLGKVFERDDFESSLPIPSVIAPVEFSVFDGYRQTNSQLIEVYLANQGNTNQDVRNPTTVSHSLDMVSPSRRRKEDLERTRGGRSAIDMLKRCFSQVPQKYFDAGFSLRDTGIFAESENSSSASLMQEHLSNWLDTVEVCLWSQTTTQAPSLFSALSDLQSLRVQVSDAANQIAVLRRKLGQVKRNVVKGNLVLLKKRREIDRLKPMVGMLDRINQVVKVVPAVKDMLATSQDYASALELIEETKATLNSELKGIRCLRALSRQLNEFQSLIGDELGGKFVEIAVSWDLNADEDEEQDTKDTSKISGVDSDLGRVPGMGVLIHGLTHLKADRFRAVMRQYRLRVIEEVELSWGKTLEATVASLSSDVTNGDVDDQNTTDGGPRSNKQVLRNAIDSLPPESYESFLSVVFGTLQVILLQARSVHSELEYSVTRIAKGSNENDAASGTTAASGEKILSISRSIFEAILGHVEGLLKVELDARRRSKVQVQMQELCNVWNRVLKFTSQVERMSESILPNHKLVSLGGALHNLPKSYLNKMHEAHKAKLVQITDEEDWKPYQEIPYQVQMIVRYIETGEQPRRASMATPSGTQQVAKSLWIQKRQYKMIRTVPILLGFVQKYLLFAQYFHAPELVLMAVDRLTKLLIKFSNLIDYLIVQAGATEANRKLESVTTKHFARSSQALSSILALLGPMETLLLGCFGKTGSREAAEVKAKMEEVRDNFLLRREQVFKGTVFLVEKLLDRYCANLSTMVNWDASERGTSNTSSRSAHQYIEDIVDKLGRFHAQLVSSLPPEQLQQVFDMVFEVINTKIPVLFADVRPTTPMGRARMKIDIKRLVSFLRQLRGTNGPGDALENFLIQRDKQVQSTST